MSVQRLKLAATLPVLAALVIAVAACTPSENADPSPEIRALCEARCFSERGTCRGSSYDCDRAAATCRRNCTEGL